MAPPAAGDILGNLSDLVYDVLAEAIREMRILPGALLSETDIRTRLQVDSAPVRAAMRRLAETGLVSVGSDLGVRVSPVCLREAEQACFARTSLETAAAKKVCAKSERDVEQLRTLLAEQERCIEQRDPDGFFTADEALHGEVFRLSGFPAAWHLLQPMKMHLDRMRRLSLADRDTMLALMAEHTEIVNALESGDEDVAVEVVGRHARRASSAVPQLRAQYPTYFAAEWP